MLDALYRPQRARSRGRAEDGRASRRRRAIARGVKWLREERRGGRLGRATRAGEGGGWANDENAVISIGCMLL